MRSGCGAFWKFEDDLVNTMTLQRTSTPLPVLLSALDRLDLEVPVHALAQDLARVCAEEGRPVTADRLVRIAREELAASERTASPAPVQALEDALRPRWLRPTCGADRQTEMNRVEAKVRRGKKGLRVLTGVGLTGVLGMLASLDQNHLPHMWGFWVLSFVWALGYRAFREHHEKVVERQKDLQELDADGWEQWARSPLARSYLARWVTPGLPLMVGDRPELERLIKMDARTDRLLSVRAFLAPSMGPASM